MSSIDATHTGSLSKVVVLGATGRLGQLLRPFWQSHPVTWQSRQVRSGFEAMDILSDQRGLVNLLEGADAVFCLAGATPANGADMDLNTTLASATLDAAAQAGAGRVFLASSAAVYGNVATTLSESDPVAPLSTYGKSKHQMEQAAQAHIHPSTSLRIGNIAGADAILGNWHADMALDQRPTGGAPERSYIGVETLARVLWTLAQRRNLPDVLNIAAPGTVAMDALLRAADLPFRYRTPAPEMVPRVHLDTMRLEGLVPFTSDESTASTMVAQWRRSIANP